MKRAGIAIGALLTVSPLFAATDYHLRPVPIADGIYAFIGATENFNRDNGGNIVNTGFMIFPEGVVVIDTGPSRAYGEQQRAAIARITPLPVVRVFNTHAHPDHFLGNQAYPVELIAALPQTKLAIETNGNALADNLYRLVGGAMTGTESRPPALDVQTSAASPVGDALRLIAASGHTDSDLAVYDVRRKVLFTGDLVFFQRTPTTPNADIPAWLRSLDALERVDFEVLVPGHGPVVKDRSAIAQTRDYLTWLDASLRAAASRGLDMPEAMQLPIPQRFRSLAVLDSEYPRSVAHLYPRLDLSSLPLLPPAATSAAPRK